MTTATQRVGARAAGGALAGTLGAIALLTRRKPLHAKGRTHHAVLRVDVPVADTTVRLLADRGQHQCVVRLSRALSTPDGWWDIGGFALRVECAGARSGPADLLFASTGVGRFGRHVLRATRHPMGEPMTTLLPVRAGSTSLLLLVRPLAGRAQEEYELSINLDGAGWSPVGIIEVGAEMPGASPRFDPFVHRLEGTSPPRWVTALREPAYRVARRLGRPTH